MAQQEANQRNIEIACEYFRRLDAASPDILDLFTDDVQIYFPKFGIGHGRDALLEMSSKLGEVVASSVHDFSDYLFIGSGDVLAVEGAVRGRLRAGQEWIPGVTPAGRFVDVFEFRDGLISRLHIYIDPDYGGEDEARFLWGREGREW
jgi:hypothetical protein